MGKTKAGAEVSKWDEILKAQTERRQSWNVEMVR
jgi:hypothetical protein